MHFRKEFIPQAISLLLVVMLFVIALSAQEPDARNRYSEKLNQAEKLFFERDYQAAKKAFQEAAKILPGETHPANRIREINRILGIEDEPNVEFLAAAQKADRLFEGEKYEEALDAYIAANDIMPDQERITDRILELHQLIRDKQARENNFNAAMQRGNQFLANRRLEEARAEFEKALALNPGSAEARSQLADISEVLNTIRQYEEAVLRADDLYMEQDYEAARAEYVQALAIQPRQAYPQNMINRIDEMINKREQDAVALQQAYQDAIENGDIHFEAQDYVQAKNYFEQAAGLMPAQSYPRAKLTEINNLLADLEILEQQYLQTISEADELFENQNYETALTTYRRALTMKPEEGYPGERIAEINTILAANIDAAFDELISAADQLFQDENWEMARAEYQKAVNLKPEAEHPQNQIAVIDNILAGMAEADAAFQTAVAAADQLFRDESWELARAEYQKAVNLNPEAEHPQNQIAAIDDILAGMAETDAAFQSAIVAADQLFQDENWELARAEYQKAVNLKPEQEHPQNQIAAIDNILAGMAEADAAFQTAVAAADQLFRDESWELARAEYQKAVNLNPEAEHPQNQIAAIDDILAGMAETDAAFQSAIVAADQLFQDENWELARAEYQKAVNLKPEQEHPQNQIAAIDNILAGMAEADAAFQSAIAAADQLFADESWEMAKAEYQKAINLNPEAEHPQNQIAAIDNILAGMAETDAAFQSAIAAADQLFQDESWEQAKAEYQKAVNLKPEEEHPQNQIAAIDNILAGMAEADAAFQTAVAAADQLFRDESWELARAEYQKAVNLNPEAEHPQNQIAAIDDILAGMAETDAAFQSAIVAADQLFQDENWELARAEYQKAVNLKPEQEHPQNQIAAIDNILAGMAEADAAFQSAIAAADQLFAG
jgi:tetratricopeptide (TPR) repeat protein